MLIKWGYLESTFIYLKIQDPIFFQENLLREEKVISALENKTWIPNLAIALFGEGSSSLTSYVSGVGWTKLEENSTVFSSWPC